MLSNAERKRAAESVWQVAGQRVDRERVVRSGERNSVEKCFGAPTTLQQLPVAHVCNMHRDSWLTTLSCTTRHITAQRLWLRRACTFEFNGFDAVGGRYNQTTKDIRMICGKACLCMANFNQRPNELESNL